MRLRGSVLIVILGLLAVLAVVGIAFVTMSSIESNTASNFALQAQFDLAADGAVDYVCQALVRDVWEYDTKPSSGPGSTYRTYTGWLLTGRFGTIPWDFPSNVLSVDPVTPTQDAFLATNWSTPTTPTLANTVYSFRAAAPTLKPYFLDTWNLDPATSKAYIGTGIPGSGTDGSPNNLGIPTGTQVLWYSPQNGLWIPELACPFENGVIRVSVTVQDHAAMVNLNAHGAPPANSGPWAPYGKAAGKGAFICDLSPVGVSGWLTSFQPANINRLLDGTLVPPGRWGTNNMPGNRRLGEIFMQNPGADFIPSSATPKDRPFGLDDEFELRRLTGTYAQSRLEQIILDSLDSDPLRTTTAKVTSRLGLTTVGWNAEVPPAQMAGGGAAPKCNLNLAADQQAGGDFQGLLDTGGVVKQSQYPNLSKQFAANVYSFAERYKPTTGGNYFRQSSGLPYGARRQLVLSQVRVQVAPASPNDTWTVRVQVFAPWANDFAGDTKTGMDSSAYRIKCYFGATVKTMNGGVVGTGVPLQISGKSVWDKQETYTDLGTGKTLDKIELEATGPGVVDRIPLSIPSTAAQIVPKYRPFGVYDEPRAADDTDPASVVTVVYVKGWQTGGCTNWNTTEGGLTKIPPGQGIPIRFPHSVPSYDATGDDAWVCGRRTGADGKGPLPPYYNMSGGGDAGAKRGIFKAFLRVADLNQVLCPTEADAANYWPWIVKVADLSGAVGAAPTTTLESQVKWDWWPTTDQGAYTLPLYDPATSIRNYRRYNGANVFCVDSPWYDSLDNDGDGVKDTAEDTGAAKDTLGEHGRFCGKEIRVAGRININTATDWALKAMDASLAGSGTEYFTKIPAKRPFLSPVMVLQTGGPSVLPPSGFYGGPLERRDYPYTLISNIATVRSDTFSIYGTVQYLQLLKGYNQAAATRSLADIKIVRTRRFWALVDRSPSLNFRPDNPAFIRPRVMNFQWLD